MLGEDESPVQQPVPSQVVYVAAIAQSQLGGQVLGAALAYSRRQCRFERCSACQIGDRVDDLGVSGAAAQVGTGSGFDRGAVERRSFLADERLSSNQNARDAESALKCAVGCEAVGEPFPFGLLEPLQCGHIVVGHLVESGGATHPCLAVDQDRAGAALTGRRAAVLGRGDIQFFPQCSEEMGVIGAHRDLFAIQSERDRLRRCRGHVANPLLRLPAGTTPSILGLRPLPVKQGAPGWGAGNRRFIPPNYPITVGQIDRPTPIDKSLRYLPFAFVGSVRGDRVA